MLAWQKFVLLATSVTSVVVGLLGIIGLLFGGEIAILVGVLMGFTMPLWMLSICDLFHVEEW